MLLDLNQSKNEDTGTCRKILQNYPSAAFVQCLHSEKMALLKLSIQINFVLVFKKPKIVS